MPITIRSSSSAITTGLGLLVPAPSGNQANDTLVAYLAYYRGGTLTPPAGWTLVATYDGAAGVKNGWYRRRLTAPIGSETWTLDGSHPIAAIVLCCPGVDSVSPLEDNDGTSRATNGTSVALPAMTATTGGAVAMYGFGVYAPQETITVSGKTPALTKTLALVSISSAVYVDTGIAVGAFASQTGAWTTSTGGGTAGIILHEAQVAPNAPTWVSPTSGGAADVAEDLVLVHAFSDDNTDDSQSAAAWKRDIGGTVRWWGGTAFDQTVETYTTTGTDTLTLTAGWGADGDASHKYYVRTKDAAGTAGAYSSALTVVPDAQANPTITSPTAGGTVTTARPTITYSVADQRAHRVEVLNDSGTTVVWDSGVKYSFVATGETVTDPLEDGVDYQARVTTWTVEGLRSDPDTNAFTVDLTEPDQPTLTTAEDPDAGAIEVTFDNPATGETVVYNDLYVRVTEGSLTDGNRTTTARRIATGLAVDAVYVDYVVGSGVEYEYMGRAWTADGAYTDSAWSVFSGDPGDVLGDSLDGGSP